MLNITKYLPPIPNINHKTNNTLRTMLGKIMDSFSQMQILSQHTNMSLISLKYILNIHNVNNNSIILIYKRVLSFIFKVNCKIDPNLINWIIIKLKFRIKMTITQQNSKSVVMSRLRFYYIILCKLLNWAYSLPAIDT